MFLGIGSAQILVMNGQHNNTTKKDFEVKCQFLQ